METLLGKGRLVKAIVTVFSTLTVSLLSPSVLLRGLCEQVNSPCPLLKAPGKQELISEGSSVSKIGEDSFL